MKSASSAPSSTALPIEGRPGCLPIPGFDDELKESHSTTRPVALRGGAGLFVRRHGDLYAVRRRGARRAWRRTRMAEDIANDRPGTGVVLSLRPLRF